MESYHIQSGGGPEVWQEGLVNEAVEDALLLNAVHTVQEHDDGRLVVGQQTRRHAPSSQSSLTCMHATASALNWSMKFSKCIIVNELPT